MSRAQSVFVVFLAAVTVAVVAFAAYVASSTLWSGRWYPGGRRGRPGRR